MATLPARNLTNLRKDIYGRQIAGDAGNEPRIQTKGLNRDTIFNNPLIGVGLLER